LLLKGGIRHQKLHTVTTQSVLLERISILCRNMHCSAGGSMTV